MPPAKQPKLTDPRHPDTTADRGDTVETLDPENVTPDVLAQLDPRTYGFTKLDEMEGEAIKNATAGPGTVDPVPALPVVSPENSTFAQRKAARLGTKVVTPADGSVDTK